ncbi:2Fe-2S ferredoxin-like protein [Rouxiella sp. S1S-2]|uniref:class I ribonucleotide reductase maintenance protein YfaE n=1 Tax=Rouxiella sp. S1S-2 TaxID=2653856 RepID=UPI00126401D6|nr:class I ribonucleotide reductase maintenance protein YfaE [Rouxiella sp. S1S-2]KAB7895925.1 2Fe-2S ferredoxin-like protein [Rouxiella sp. S1S-2]
MSQPIITLQDSGTTLVCEGEHNNLLEVFEYHKVVVEYQCREGYCGSCRMRLLKGEVAYSAKPLAFIQDGDILPCCCLPIGDVELAF